MIKLTMLCLSYQMPLCFIAPRHQLPRYWPTSNDTWVFSHSLLKSLAPETLQWHHYECDGISNHRHLICSGADQRKLQSSASLAFVRGIQQWLVNSPHKGPVTWKMFQFDNVIMRSGCPFKNARFILYSLIVSFRSSYEIKCPQMNATGLYSGW